MAPVPPMIFHQVIGKITVEIKIKIENNLKKKLKNVTTSTHFVMLHNNFCIAPYHKDKT